MPDNLCPACGAPNAKVICPFCGTASRGLTDPAEELKALDAFWALIASKDRANRVRLLESGYMPAGKKALIEDGMRLVPLLKAGDLFVAETAKHRLEAVVLRLSVLAQDDEVMRAREALEGKLRQLVGRERRDVLAFLTVLALGCAAAAAVFWVSCLR